MRYRTYAGGVVNGGPGIRGLVPPRLRVGCLGQSPMTKDGRCVVGNHAKCGGAPSAIALHAIVEWPSYLSRPPICGAMLAGIKDRPGRLPYEGGEKRLIGTDPQSTVIVGSSAQLMGLKK